MSETTPPDNVEQFPTQATETAATETSQPVAESQAPEQAKPEITLGDISSVVTTIDVLAGRGVFKGNELTFVGNLRDKFASFVQFYTPVEPAKAATV